MHNDLNAFVVTKDTHGGANHQEWCGFQAEAMHSWHLIQQESV